VNFTADIKFFHVAENIWWSWKLKECVNCKRNLSLAFQLAFGVFRNASTSNWEINRIKQIIVSYNSVTRDSRFVVGIYLVVWESCSDHPARMEEKMNRYLRWTVLTIIHLNDKWKQRINKLKHQLILEQTMEGPIMLSTCISRGRKCFYLRIEKDKDCAY
jgi:hypothetical protein